MRWMAPVLLCLAVAAVLAAFIVPQLTASPDPGGGTTTAVPSIMTPSQPPPQASTTTPTPSPPAESATVRGKGATSAPTHLSIEAAGIDVVVLPLTPTGEALAQQTLVPPFTEDGYWLTAYGKPGAESENTTYITGHSWNDREAPFDRLSTHTEIGDAVQVMTAAGAVRFTVDSINTYDKDTLKDSEIWNIVPNRLVLISCYTEDPEGKNVVVTASPIG